MVIRTAIIDLWVVLAKECQVYRFEVDVGCHWGQGGGAGHLTGADGARHKGFLDHSLERPIGLRSNSRNISNSFDVRIHQQVMFLNRYYCSSLPRLHFLSFVRAASQSNTLVRLVRLCRLVK